MLILNNMTLRDKLGQVMMVGFHCQEACNDIKEMIRDYRIGSIISFPRNVRSQTQISSLLKELQDVAAVSGHVYPLITTTDQENGRVAHRIGFDAVRFPGNMALGAMHSKNRVYEIAKAQGRELIKSGFNVVLSPSLDINSNYRNPVIGVRSFGDSADKISKQGTALIEGLQDAGVGAVAKHFPGHGDTMSDSHLELPTVHHSLERLRQYEFIPFKAAVDHHVDMIMTSHIYFSKIEKKGVPATFSEKLLNGILRKELGFEGIIISDCLEMNAISKTFGTTEGAVKAFLAGVDLLIVSHSFEVQKQVYQRLLKAVETGEISEERLDESVNRILSFKKRLVKLQEEAKDKPYKNREERIKLAADAMENAITIVKNEEQLIPVTIKEDEKMVVVNAVTAWQSHELYEEKGAQILPEVMKKYHSNVVEARLSPEAEQLELYTLYKEASIIVVMTSNAYLHKDEANLVNSILKANQHVVIVAMNNPYDIISFPSAHTYLATYEPSKLAAEVIGDILFGKRKAKGKLPVTIPEQSS